MHMALNARSRRNAWIALAGLVLLLCADVVFAQTSGTAPVACALGQGGGILDSFVKQFQSGTSGWMTTAQNYAKHIFSVLAGVEFAWAGIIYLLQKNDLNEYLVAMILKIMALSFFGLFLIAGAPTYIPDIINSFTQMGQGFGAVSSGAATTSPSAIVSVGTCLATNIVTGAAPSNFFSAMFAAVFALLGAIAIWASFLVIALQLLFTQIESYIVLGAGAVMLGFLGSRWTTSWGERYFGYAVSVGVKLMVIYLIVGLGINIVIGDINSFTAMATNTIVGASGSDASTLGLITGTSTGVSQATQGVAAMDYLNMGVAAILFAAIAWGVPGMAGTFMNGTPSMSIAAAATPIGMVTAVATGAIAGGAAGAMKLGKLIESGLERLGGASGGGDGLQRLGSLTGASGGGSGGSTLGSIAGATAKGVAAAGSAAGSAMKAGGSALAAAGPVGAVASAGMRAAGAVNEVAGKAAGAADKTAGAAGEVAQQAGDTSRGACDLSEASATHQPRSDSGSASFAANPDPATRSLAADTGNAAVGAAAPGVASERPFTLATAPAVPSVPASADGAPKAMSTSKFVSDAPRSGASTVESSTPFSTSTNRAASTTSARFDTAVPKPGSKGDVDVLGGPVRDAAVDDQKKDKKRIDQILHGYARNRLGSAKDLAMRANDGTHSTVSIRLSHPE